GGGGRSLSRGQHLGGLGDDEAALARALAVIGGIELIRDVARSGGAHPRERGHHHAMRKRERAELEGVEKRITGHPGNPLGWWAMTGQQHTPARRCVQATVRPVRLRPSALRSGGRARCYNRRHASVAQWIEHLPPKERVARSIRAGGATACLIRRVGRQFPDDPPDRLVVPDRWKRTAREGGLRRRARTGRA